jgi:hypothetical protein
MAFELCCNAGPSRRAHFTLLAALLRHLGARRLLEIQTDFVSRCFAALASPASTAHAAGASAGALVAALCSQLLAEFRSAAGPAAPAAGGEGALALWLPQLGAALCSRDSGARANVLSWVAPPLLKREPGALALLLARLLDEGTPEAVRWLCHNYVVMTRISTGFALHAPYSPSPSPSLPPPPHPHPHVDGFGLHARTHACVCACAHALPCGDDGMLMCGCCLLWLTPCNQTCSMWGRHLPVCGEPHSCTLRPTLSPPHTPPPTLFPPHTPRPTLSPPIPLAQLYPPPIPLAQLYSPTNSPLPPPPSHLLCLLTTDRQLPGYFEGRSKSVHLC